MKAFDFEKCKKIGLRLSGGADSAILLYLICKNIREQNLSIDYIQPVTFIGDNDLHAGYYATGVFEVIAELFYDIEIRNPLLIKWPDNLNEHQEVMNHFFDEYLSLIDILFDGMNFPPPLEVTNNFSDKDNGPEHGRADRMNMIERTILDNGIIFKLPFAKMDKKGIHDLYVEYNLLETLFPLTRSCINQNFPHSHCGECWWCEERLWAFGKLQ